MKKQNTYHEEYDFLSNAASTQDCTGLIPAAPVDEAELEAYEAVYHYQPPKIEKKYSDEKS